VINGSWVGVPTSPDAEISNEYDACMHIEGDGGQTVISTQLEQNFAKPGLHVLAYDPTDILTSSERNWWVKFSILCPTVKI
jgi:hypothetical protein